MSQKNTFMTSLGKKCKNAACYALGVSTLKIILEESNGSKLYYYYGEVDETGKIAEGHGELYYEDNKRKKYVGEFKQNLFNGKGEVYYTNGSIEFKGTFKNGLLNDKTGYQYDITVNKEYTGEFKNGEKNGKITCYETGGFGSKWIYFKGTYANDYAIDGTKYNSDGSKLLEGILVPHTYNLLEGTMYKDGSVYYTGKFELGYPIFTFKYKGTNCIYNGEVNKEGLPHGGGTLKNKKNSIIIHAGNFQNGVPVGKSAFNKI